MSNSFSPCAAVEGENGEKVKMGKAIRKVIEILKIATNANNTAQFISQVLLKFPFSPESPRSASLAVKYARNLKPRFRSDTISILFSFRGELIND